ncbi:CheR family methyltransferase [Undibacterium arcticum]
MSTARFEALLKHTMGLDAASIGPAMIERAVRERLATSGAIDLDAYWQLVQTSDTELQALIEAVIVPETWFFRDREALEALARLAWQQSLRTQPERPLRLLSLPCSTGEEPYSIAMALLDAGLPAARFHIDAVDICTRSIATAERAVYGRNSFRGKLLDYRARHFTPMGDGYVLADSVRQQVRFQHGNLFAPGLLAGENAYDFVFCRNVLIYFDRATQERAILVLDKLLSATGFLFVGPAEAGLFVRQTMISAGIPLAFAFRKTQAATPDPLPFRHAAQPAPQLAAISRPTLAIAAPRKIPARAPLQMEIQTSPKQLDEPTLSRATRLANQGQLAEAAAICQQHLQQTGPSAAAFLLDGTGQRCWRQSY